MDWSIVAKIARDGLRIDRIRYPRAKVLFVAHDSNRSILYQRKWYAPFIDTIADELHSRGIATLGIARIHSRLKGGAAHGRVYSPEGAFARALLTKRLSKLLAKSRYPYSSAEERIWGRIIDESGVDRVIGVQPSRELCVACRKRGIWVADLQHGVIAETHPWYGRIFREGDPAEFVPTAFLCWDQSSAEVLNGWIVHKNSEAIVIGNPWLQRFVDPQPGDQLVAQLSVEHGSLLSDIRARPSILVALSWGQTDVPNGFMVDALRDAIRNSSQRFKWLVRLHPNQLNGYATNEFERFVRFYRENLAGHCDWERASRAPLPLVLGNASATVSWNSSVCIEAAQLGKKSVLLDPQLRPGGTMADYYKVYRDTGLIHVIDQSETTILDWLAVHLKTDVPAAKSVGRRQNYHQLIEFLCM